MKYVYGPLVWNCLSDSDESGNYLWNGSPPVGYDSSGIPIDDNGLQCLPLACPLHPNHKPTIACFNVVIRDNLPSIAAFRTWFDDNYLILADHQIKLYIVRWYSFQRTKTAQWHTIQQTSKTVDEVIDVLWP